jgi:hypothetical protein
VSRTIVIAAIALAPLQALADEEPPADTEAAEETETAADKTDAVAEPAKPTPPPASGAAKEAPSKPKTLSLSGYLSPSLAVVHRGDAVPRDRWRYGAESTRAGVIFSGTPIARWSYHLEAVVAGETNDLVATVDTVDTNGDGVADGIAPMTERVPGIFVERAVVELDAGAGFSIVAGQLRIPFTVQEQSPSTQLMFPGRSGPNEVFVQGPDLGLDVVYRAPADRFVAHAGAFNGTGEPVEATSEHGLVYSARVDVNPLGEFPVGEANTAGGPLRVGVGAGALFYASRTYDAAGFPGSRQRDLRASASFRIAAGGLYVQTEGLRRQRTDSLSGRPEITTGAYAQMSYYTAAAVGFAPLARLGWAAEDQGFAERTTLWFEGGVAIYPNADDPDALKIIVQYLGERRLTEAEQANGVVAQAQLIF